MRGRLHAALAILALTVTPLAAAEPHVPDDDTVIAEVPEAGGLTDQPRDLRRRLARQPDNQELAVALARHYIGIGRNTGDSRYYGYAQAALGPWWQQPSPPPAVQLLRADILQHRHLFTKALDDLDAVLRRHPRNGQARLMRATVRQATGDYEGAAADCRATAGRIPPLITVSCLSRSQGLAGRAPTAYRRLAQVLEERREVTATSRLEAQLTLAELSVSEGWQDKADAHFQAALSLDADAGHTLAVYADHLLATQRPAQVLTLLRREEADTGLLLRYALACEQADCGEMATLRGRVKQRFDLARLRDDWHPDRDYARYLLELEDSPHPALNAAEAAWERQREPADAWILMQAALAADAPEAAKPVIRWLRQRGHDSVRVNALIARLEETAS